MSAAVSGALSAAAEGFPVGMRVLVIDHDECSLAALCQMLLGCRYNVTTCSQSTMALGMLVEGRVKFDLVLTEAHMPDIDGFKLIEHVGLQMEVPVVVMSADSSASSMLKALNCGAVNYLVKPIATEELKTLFRLHNYSKHGKSASIYYSDQSRQASNTRRRIVQMEEEKRLRLIWTPTLHESFVDAALSGIYDPVSIDSIMRRMNVQGLSRQNVDSHLQKYSLYLKKMARRHPLSWILCKLDDTTASEPQVICAEAEVPLTHKTRRDELLRQRPGLMQLSKGCTLWTTTKQQLKGKAMEEKECDKDTCRMELEGVIYDTHVIMDLAEWWVDKNEMANLLQETRDVVYDAEDLLAELKVKTEGNTIKFTHSGSCSSMELGYFNKVKEIEQKLDNFTTRMILLGLYDPRQLFLNESIRLESNSFPEECNMFSYEKEFSKLLQLLGVSSSSAINESQTGTENVPVLPIIGRGGVGKTTLALQVFNDKNARGYFDRTIWITASNDFHEKDLIKKFILSVAECEMESDDLSCIQRVLTSSIIDQSKRFLLVIDNVQEDVCTEVSDGWRSSLAVLKHAKPGTIVLMTTRSLKVANIFGTVDPFLLGGFPEVTLWKYFKICVFGSDSFNINRSLEDIGRRIVEKLNGVPLAAKILGRLLSLNPTAEFWNSILTSELWELPEEETRVCPAVLLSYQYLPSHLKRCFSYCSTYPKDYKFDKDTLVDCWQAVGLLVPHGDMVVHQDVGHIYFHQLVNRSFFQKTQSSSEYVMHDMLHDMATFVSKNECFMIRDKNDLASVNPNIRHLSVLSSSGLDGSCLKILCRYKKLRSLVCYGVESSIITPAVECWLHGLTNIRMLSFVSCQLMELPESIGNIRHLRNLNISACTFDKLPSSFWNLHNLEILDAQKCKFQYLPKDVSKLINLRKVKLNGDLANQFRNIPEIGKLMFLQELPYFDVANEPGRGIGELKNMNHLHGSLEISGLCNVMSKDDAAKAELHMKNYLDTLILSWDESFTTCTRQKSSGQEMEVLEGLYPPPYLKHLKIKCYTGVEFRPSWFRKEKLRDLSSLSIYSCPKLKSMSFQSSAGSSNRSSIGLEWLTRLSISRCRRLSSLERFLQPSYLPAIKVIHIEKCEDLVSLPVQGFAGFVHLEDLELSECWNLNWPADQVFPPSLKVLKLEACGYLFESTLSCLRSLGALTTLKLQFCHSVESIPAQVWSGLPSLENLAIFYCKGLQSIGGSEAIAQIENVDVRDCPNLQDLEQPFHKGSNSQ